MKPMFSKRHYEIIGRMLYDLHHTNGSPVNRVAGEFIKLFMKNNYKFNEKKVLFDG